jgi:polysaccharide export outer membrane protein
MKQFLVPTTIMLLALTSLRSLAQTAQPAQIAQQSPTAPTVPGGVPLPPDFVIGPEDGLGVIFWHEPEMSGDVVVRPDGLITLPLIGAIRAAGLKPEALREEIQKAASPFLNEVNVMVVVRQINSRTVFITGEVAKPGAYPLAGPRTVMQLIALAGGLNEYADANSITVMRIENGHQRSFQFHYRDVARGKALAQNITLQPGDTVVVP